MAQINSFLKCIFTVFNVFFAIVGGAIVGLGVLCQIFISAQVGEQLQGQYGGLVMLYIMGLITMVIAIVGACGAQKESKACLIVFLVCMVIGSLLMLRAGIPAAVIRPELAGQLEEKFHQAVPLDTQSSTVQEMANNVQAELHCCGLFSYKDWRNSIPDSCDCREVEGYQCTVVDYRNYFQTESKSVYSEPCFPIIRHYVLLVVDIIIGIVFVLAALAVLGMILSSIMIHQLRHPNRPTVLLTVPAIFTSGPPKYQELHNPPPPPY